MSSKRLLRFVLLPFLAGPLAAQFHYELAFDTAERNWSVVGSFGNPGGGDVDYWIARWTPGAYHVADYGRLIEDLSAADGSGKKLAVERIDDSHFRIASMGAEEVVVRYQASSLSDGIVSHGVVLDVESNRIREGYAYLTPVSLVGFVPDRIDEPFTLRVELPNGWKAATALTADEAGIYRAESYRHLEDSPLLFSPDLVTVESEAGGKPLTVTVLGKRGEELDELVEACRRISEAAIGLMGGAPYDRYHYLIGFVKEGFGSGLEHSFSTLILLPEGSPVEPFHGIIAHEFFHLWCAERIHVQGIREADFTQPFQTGTIWVNECMTEYMTQHVLLHAGFLDHDGFLAAVGPVPEVLPLATALPSLVETSRRARDWQSFNDLGAFAGKIYQYGPRVVFALDLEMRKLSEGERGVVDFLRHVMSEYDAQGRGFDEDEVPDILNAVASGDLTGFLERCVVGQEFPSFSELVGVIGYRLEEGRIRPLEEATEEQMAAREDFFSLDG